MRLAAISFLLILVCGTAAVSGQQGAGEARVLDGASCTAMADMDPSSMSVSGLKKVGGLCLCPSRVVLQNHPARRP